MTKRDKILQRFFLKPRDFTGDELVKMLAGFRYELLKTGKSGGSRVKYVHETLPPIFLHRPHPAKVLKRYQIEQIEALLKNEGLI